MPGMLDFSSDEDRPDSPNGLCSLNDLLSRLPEATQLCQPQPSAIPVIDISNVQPPPSEPFFHDELWDIAQDVEYEASRLIEDFDISKPECSTSDQDNQQCMTPSLAQSPREESLSSITSYKPDSTHNNENREGDREDPADPDYLPSEHDEDNEDSDGHIEEISAISATDGKTNTSDFVLPSTHSSQPYSNPEVSDENQDQLKKKGRPLTEKRGSQTRQQSTKAKK